MRKIDRLFITLPFMVLLLSGVSPSLARYESPDPIPKPPPVSTASQPLLVRVYFSNLVDLKQLASQFDIWEVDHSAGYALISVDLSEYDHLLQQGYKLDIDYAKMVDLSQLLPANPEQFSGIPNFSCYRTVEETYTDLAQLAQEYPNLAQWVDIGDSWEKITSAGSSGYDLYALVLTNQSTNLPTHKPRFFLMGAIHAREYVTAELATRFVEYLLENYNLAPDVTWLLDYNEIHVIPVVNPDGRKIAELGVYQRKNTDDSHGDACESSLSNQIGVDLNRNHSFNWGGASFEACSEVYQGPSAASEPETHALETYLRSIFPDRPGAGKGDPEPDSISDLLVSLHSYGDLVLWPWGYTYNPAPNDSALKTLGHKLAYFNAYLPEQSSDLYPTTGDTTDFAYGELGVPSYTFELGGQFFEQCLVFEEKILPDNLKALMYAFKSARLPFQNPSGPDVVQISASPATLSTGVNLHLAALADDSLTQPGVPIEKIASARYSIDTPSWITGTLLTQLEPLDGEFDTSAEELQTDIDTTALSPGRHTIFVEAQDSAGNWGVPSGIFFQLFDPNNNLYLPIIGH
jgi:carboxypeptidase T